MNSTDQRSHTKLISAAGDAVSGMRKGKFDGSLAASEREREKHPECIRDGKQWDVDRNYPNEASYAGQTTVKIVKQVENVEWILISF